MEQRRINVPTLRRLMSLYHSFPSASHPPSFVRSQFIHISSMIKLIHISPFYFLLSLLLLLPPPLHLFINPFIFCIASSFRPSYCSSFRFIPPEIIPTPPPPVFLSSFLHRPFTLISTCANIFPSLTTFLTVSFLSITVSLFLGMKHTDMFRNLHKQNKLMDGAFGRDKYGISQRWPVSYFDAMQDLSALFLQRHPVVLASRGKLGSHCASRCGWAHNCCSTLCAF